MSTSDMGRQYRELVAVHGSPLLVMDCDTVREQYRALGHALPGAEIYYAVKSLPHPSIVQTVLDAGGGLELASNGEIELIRSLKVSPRRTIHTHPIKRDRDIVDALRFGCTTFVVDNTDELLKFLPYKHRIGLLLRVSFRSHAAVVDLSKKFGCALGEASELIRLGADLGVHIKGLSFHVGSQCADTTQQVNAIHQCNTLIRRHHDIGAAPMSVLDIGGGFPVSYDGGHVDINRYCELIRDALKELPSYVNVIAEPGRFLSAPAMTSVSTIVGKAIRDGMHWYYLDDGVYGSFSGQLFDHMRYPLEVFSSGPGRYPSVLAGPTCDSIDVIAEDLMLPEMGIGDLIVGHMMGAYTAASATSFNSVPKTKIIVRHDPVNYDAVDESLKIDPFVRI
ncbi:MAG: type III PLP-dependent enzyme [Desulfobacteraceae bacterium]|nr:type III PLP-dependent enzyme [Desulfobacteraceae bacterium]